MKSENTKSEALLKYGEVLKKNDFQTGRGFYTIRIIRVDGDLYFHKMKDGDVVEIMKLT